MRCVGIAGVIYYCISTSNIDFTKWICASAVIHSVITISFMCGMSLCWHPYIKLTDLSAVGYLVCTNYAGPYLAICCPLFFRLRKRFWGFVILPIIAIFILDSMTGVLALFMGLAMMVDKRLIIVAVIAGAIYIHYFEESKYKFFNHHRFYLRWLPHLKTQLGGHWINILLGYGAHAQADYIAPSYTHSGFLSCFLKFGAIGLGIVGWYMVTIYKKIKNDRVFRGCFFAIITAVVGIHAFHMPTLAFLILVLLAMFEHKKQIKKEALC